MKNQRTFHQNVVCWSMEPLKLLFHQKFFFKVQRPPGPGGISFGATQKIIVYPHFSLLIITSGAPTNTNHHSMRENHAK